MAEKKLKVKRKSFKQGVFNPEHGEKYKGRTPIIYRSSLEFKVMKWMDRNPHIISWGAESVIIPYLNPVSKTVRRYFTDLNCTIKRKDNTIQKLIIEIKPHSQTIPPTVSSRKKPSTMAYEQKQWAINQAKWKAAKEWGAKNNKEFIILTEKHIKI